MVKYSRLHHLARFLKLFNNSVLTWQPIVQFPSMQKLFLVINLLILIYMKEMYYWLSILLG